MARKGQERQQKLEDHRAVQSAIEEAVAKLRSEITPTRAASLDGETSFHLGQAMGELRNIGARLIFDISDLESDVRPPAASSRGAGGGSGGTGGEQAGA